MVFGKKTPEQKAKKRDFNNVVKGAKIAEEVLENDGCRKCKPARGEWCMKHLYLANMDYE